jgi:hypothetical protein
VGSRFGADSQIATLNGPGFAIAMITPENKQSQKDMRQCGNGR